MPPARRQPLGEATRRVNNSQDRQAPPKNKISAHESRRSGIPVQCQPQAHPYRSPLFQMETHSVEARTAVANLPGSHVVSHQHNANSKDYQTNESKRNSQASTVSSGASDGRKRDVGPWNLGKTLGEGATARVRKARNRYTGAVAAVKIVQKSDARLSQAGSLAALDHIEASRPEEEGARRMPLGIEREVAIMKLIDHPNVMKLHDIWENRNEIYLVLEFVDNGELFDYISERGKLREKEAMKFWRQILSAVGYCHSFNICHRDLKPENILLTKDGNIKIADFGMAALQQTQHHRLNTSCGSPHYAAPEVINGSKYQGDKVDIWSMGVILYATLAGTLPFDHPGPGIQGLLALVKKGKYEMSPFFSNQAKDLIYRILRLSPKERPTIKQIWQHALLRKYDHLDNLSLADRDTSPSTKECGRPVRRVSEIERDILRHLRSMWHRSSETELIAKLLSEEPNDQKRFYTLLLNHKEAQLENYTPELDYSSSDYHHARPLNQVRKLSTRQFSQPNANGHGRQISRFTVIGNGSKEPTGLSYDPFKVSKPQKVDQTITDHANFTTFGNDKVRDPDRKSSAGGLQVPPNRALRGSSMSASSSANSRVRPPGRRGYNTRNSLASSTRSRGSTPGAVKPNIGHKRRTSFSHSKRPGANESRISQVASDLSHPEGGDELSELRSFTGGRNVSGRYIRSKKTTGALLQPSLVKRKSNRLSRFWEDDVRQVSNSLEEDCDTAFNKNALAAAASVRAATGGLEFRTKIRSAHLSSFLTDDINAIESSPRISHNLQAKSGKAWWDQRPLPKPPARSESVNIELAEARKHAEYRKASGNMEDPHLDHRLSHIDHLMQPTSSPFRPTADRRTRSAPVPRNGETQRVLESIQESSADGLLAHCGSDLESQACDDRTDARTFQNGIRLVPESSPGPSPIKPTAPLKIVKQGRKGDQPALMTGALGAETRQGHRTYDHNLRQTYTAGPRAEVSKDLPRIDEYEDADDNFDVNSNGTVRHKPWFKRSYANAPQETVKKKGFGLGTLFKKRGAKDGPEMMIALDAEDTIIDSQESFAEDPQYTKLGGSRLVKDLKVRQAEPHQSWIARLFKVKPEPKYICCCISRRRAREELATLFKEWKRYGMTDVVVDKNRNIVFARVQTPNYLEMKEVSFAAEVMTVIEHGKRNSLSIIRVTQTKGAASAMDRVVIKLVEALAERGMIEKDKRKAKMMVKTLIS